MAATEEPGTAFLVWKDPTKSRTINCMVERTDPMDDGKADPRLLPVVPYKAGGIIFEEDDYLTIDMEFDAEDGIDYTDSQIRVPVTFENKRTGDIFPATIGKAGTYKFTFVADATVFAAATKKEWGYFQVPAGMRMVVGQKNPVNSKLLIAPYDDTA